jgi:hypothetical protein
VYVPAFSKRFLPLDAYLAFRIIFFSAIGAPHAMIFIMGRALIANVSFGWVILGTV